MLRATDAVVEPVLRVARERDIPAIAALIPLSVRALQAADYSTAQMDAALGPVFGVDRELIRDGTYFVVEHLGELVGCGGWSRRRSLFGGDAGRAAGESALLDSAHDSARIRAFFVHPDWARRGIGRQIMHACNGRLHTHITVRSNWSRHWPVSRCTRPFHSRRWSATT